MIPLIQNEILANGWLTTSEFTDIIAISQMTPGPIAVNSATFVGYKIAGLLGGLVATFGVALPSLIMVLIVSKYFLKFQKHKLNAMIFYGIRPVIVGLIISAAVFVAQTSLFKPVLSSSILNVIMSRPLDFFDIKGIIILILTLVSLIKYKLNPMLAIVGSGFIGVILYYFI